MPDKQSIIFRVDGNAIIGLGHFFRSLALAELLKENFDCVMAISMPDNFIKQQLKSEGIRLVELRQVEYKKPIDKSVGEEIPFDMDGLLDGSEIVVLDGYWFGGTYQHEVKKAGSTLVYIDDVCEEYPAADVIINHAVSASSSQYKNTSAKIFTGPDYALMRKEFLEVAQQQNVKSKFDTVLICFGGADTEELALKTAGHLALVNSVRNIYVLNSSSYGGEMEKFNRLADEIGKRISVHQNLSANEIIELMSKSDLAIVAASNIAYECACAGLPMVVGYYVDHQKQFYESLLFHENIVGVGQWQHTSADHLRLQIEALVSNYEPNRKSIIDGFQKKRFLSLFSSLIKNKNN